MQFRRKILKNGITVLYEKRDLPIVSISIANRVGASSETSDIKGISHVIEHMLFTGTKTRTNEDISKEIENRGGVLNAFTAQDVTSYWFKLPSEHAITGLNILIDMLKNATFAPKKFDKEKKVILEEIKMYHDSPQRHVHEKIIENLYENPFGMGISGTKETVSSLERNFVFNYFKKFYSPENYIVTIVGNTNFEKVCELLERSFKKQNNPLPVIAIKKKNSQSIEARKGIDQAHFVFAVHAPEPASKESYALEVLDAHLASGMSSRLSLEIREKRSLAYAVHSSLNMEKSHSDYNIYVGTRKESLEEVKKIILKEFKKIGSLTERQLKEAKERLIGLKKVSSEESIHVMNDLLFAELITGDARNYYNYENEIKKVRLSDVKKLAKINSYSTAAIVPE